MNEGQWQRKVRELAELYGWEIYHTHNSQRSDAGWPDLVLCKPPRVLFVELKSEKGRVRPDQRKWLELLSACGQEAGLWRPADLSTATRVLGPRAERLVLTL